MPGFDIGSLVEFKPPVSRCWLCLALWAEVPKTGKFICPGCSSIYVPHLPILSNVTTLSMTTTYNFWSPTYGPIYTETGPGRKISLGGDPMTHAIDLAKLAVELREITRENPPLRVLMKLLEASRSFIHITSFNFDEFTLALLEMAAQRTSIAAIFSGVDTKRQPLLEQVNAEAPALEYRVEGTRADIGDQNHGKLIVIDGLLAIIGSPNLTRPGWRKAAANMEIVEVVTDVTRVAELSNRYFSPLWKRLQPDSQQRYSVENWTLVTTEDPEYSSTKGELEESDDNA
jgi:hypothetical protein